MSRRIVQILAGVAALSVWGGGGLAQEIGQPVEDLSRVFERLQQQDRQARENGFVLESFPVRQPENDSRQKSMKLSVGEVGGTPGARSFDDDRSNYLLDPHLSRRRPSDSI